jgi:hypothetical protein
LAAWQVYEKADRAGLSTNLAATKPIVPDRIRKFKDDPNHREDPPD